jgi:hypothetical protein
VTAEETSAKQAAERALAELQTSFQQERGRAKRLEDDLATLRSELESRSMEVAKANEEAAQIRRTAENGVAKLRSSLKEEHERADALAQEFSLVRAKLFAYEAQAAANDQAARVQQSAGDGPKELQELLQKERARSSRLEQQLVTARRNLETRAAAGTSNVEAVGTPTTRDAWSRLLDSTPQQFQPPLQELASKPNKAKVPSSSLSVVTAEALDRISPIEAQTSGRPAAGIGDVRLEHEQVRLIARASGLLGQGDIGAARAVLERAAELGSAQASFALAETYDPNILVKWGAYGTRSDAIRARELYARAEAGGIKEAKARFDALGH